MLRLLVLLMNIVVSYSLVYENSIVLTSFKYISYLIGGFSLVGYIFVIIFKNKDKHVNKSLIEIAMNVQKYSLLNNIFTFINIVFICVLFGYEKVLFGLIWTFVYLLLPFLVKGIARDVYEKTLILKK